MTAKGVARDYSRARWLGLAERVRILGEQTQEPLADPADAVLRRCSGHCVYAQASCEVTDVKR